MVHCLIEINPVCSEKSLAREVTFGIEDEKYVLRFDWHEICFGACPTRVLVSVASDILFLIARNDRSKKLCR